MEVGSSLKGSYSTFPPEVVLGAWFLEVEKVHVRQLSYITVSCGSIRDIRIPLPLSGQQCNLLSWGSLHSHLRGCLPGVKAVSLSTLRSTVAWQPQPPPPRISS